MSFSEFLAMGKHGFYVWTSYGVGAILFVVIYWVVKSQFNAMVQQLNRRYIRDQRNAKLQKKASLTTKASDINPVSQDVLTGEEQ